MIPKELHEVMKTYEKVAPILKIHREISTMQQQFRFATTDYDSLLSKIIELSQNLPKGELREAFRQMRLKDIMAYEWSVPEQDGEEPSVVLDTTSRIQRVIADIYADHASLLKVDPRLFEEVIAEILAKQGFSVELTQQTRDNGYDIRAIQKIGDHPPLKFLVECKRYTGGVGVNVVRSFHHVLLKEQANRGILVTTSYFTKGALTEVQNPWLLDFRDKDKVLDWVDAYYKKHLR